MTEAEFDHFLDQLQILCGALQIDLAWLDDQVLARDPALQATLRTIVFHCIQAQHQAADIQADLQAFECYQAIKQRPYSQENQQLIERLYAQLVKAGLTSPARPEALGSTERIRVEYMLRAIENAATSHRSGFYQTLNQVSHNVG